MSTTKKLLVPHNPAQPDEDSDEFVYPTVHEGQPCFQQMESDLRWDFARVVYIGMEVTMNDIFARVVDTSEKIPSVKKLSDELSAYIAQITNHKVGQIVTISPSEDPAGFSIVSVS